ncbi:MAG: hypothetical protein JXR23_02980 [Pontiellaceae bacterium]|nr:hypothetical protein [Pontiellaceae bacterium]
MYAKQKTGGIAWRKELGRLSVLPCLSAGLSRLRKLKLQHLLRAELPRDSLVWAKAVPAADSLVWAKAVPLADSEAWEWG